MPHRMRTAVAAFAVVPVLATAACGDNSAHDEGATPRIPRPLGLR